MKNRKTGLVCLAAILAVLCLAGLAAGEKTVKGPNQRFYQVREKLDEGGSLYLYMDVKDALKNILEDVRNQFSNAGAPQQANMVFAIADQAIDALGLYDIHDIGVSMVNMEQSTRMKVFIRVPGEKKGLFPILGGPPHAFDDLKYAPADTTFFNTVDMDPSAALALVRDMIQRTAGAAVLANFNTNLVKAGEDMGVDIEKTIGSLGGRFFAVGCFNHEKPMSVPVNRRESASVPTPEFLLAAHVKDDTLYGSISSLLTKNGIQYEETNEGALKKMLIRISGESGFQPVIATGDGLVFFATSPFYLEKILATARSGQNLGTSTEYLSLRKGLPEKGNELLFVSSRFSKDMNDIVKVFLNQQLLKQRGSEMVAWATMITTLVESGEESAMAAVRVNDPEGIRVVSQSPGRGFSSLGSTLAAPVLLPVAALYMPRAREANVRSACSRVRADHRILATAVESYYVDWSSYPPSSDFETVVSRGGGDSMPTLRRITTPIAYITRIPDDPFSETGDVPYFYFTPDPEKDAELIEKNIRWISWSVGPDGVNNIRSRDCFKHPKWFDLFYDPTNGTNSAGDIIRTIMGTRP